MSDPITHHTEQLEKSRVDAALAALGLTKEVLENVDQVTISVGKVTVRAVVVDDEGRPRAAHSVLGTSVPYIVHEYDIVPDGTGEDLDARLAFKGISIG